MDEEEELPLDLHEEVVLVELQLGVLYIIKLSSHNMCIQQQHKQHSEDLTINQ